MTYRKSFPLRKNRLIFLNISLITLIIIVGVFYLFQVNVISSYSFKMKELNDKLEGLKINNAQMEQTVISLESIGNLYQLSVNSDMVKIAQVDYLVSPETSVAVKK